MGSEFNHYSGCRGKDPDNCSGCALTTGGENGPNYAGWPLSYLESNRDIPSKWYDAVKKELASENRFYADFLRNKLSVSKYKFLVEKTR